MIDYTIQFKEDIIKNYIANIDEKTFSIKQIQTDLQRELKEMCGVKPTWINKQLIQETADGQKKTVNKESLKDIEITFTSTDSNGNNIAHKVSYYF
jgi:hypothetical protein